MDPVARFDDDDEALRLGSRVRRRSRAPSPLGYGRHGQAPPRRPDRPRPRSRHRPFEELVERALAAIPEPFASALDEVAIVIADEPTADQLRENELEPDDDALRPVRRRARTEWGADWAPVPNRITLFRLPLEDDFADPDDLADEVWVTVIHELAHHLGIDDDRLHELGVD